MDRVFQIIAVGLAGLAAYFLWAGNSDAAFASASVTFTDGVVARAVPAAAD